MYEHVPERQELMGKNDFIIHHFFGYYHTAGQEDCIRKTSVNGSDNLEISCRGGTEPFHAQSRFLVSHIQLA